MPSIARRTLLRLLASAPAVPLLASAGCADDDTADRVFPQGVASFEPTPDGILLWTRVEGGGDASYELARDPDFTDVVATGELVAVADADFTLRVDVGGL